jgi:hypothetical protein
MKYCIGCEHWSFQEASDPYRYSTLTYSNGTPASMSCQKGHWNYLEMKEGFTQSDFEQAMEKAEKCPDFQERSAETVSGEQK